MPGFLRALLMALALPVSASCWGTESLPISRDAFEQTIRPFLVQHCIRCHGDSRSENGLQLTSRAGMLRGGESGAAVVPGEPDASLLIQAIRYERLEMPPDGPVDPPTIAAVGAWIESGAPWPADVVLTEPDKDRDRTRHLVVVPTSLRT